MPTRRSVFHGLMAVRFKGFWVPWLVCMAACSDLGSEQPQSGSEAAWGAGAQSVPASPAMQSSAPQEATEPGMDYTASAPTPPAGAGSPFAQPSTTVQPDAGATETDSALPPMPATPAFTDSAEALNALEGYLQQPRMTRPALDATPFAQVALSREDAELAQAALWEDLANHVRETRAGEVGADERTPAELVIAGQRLRYYQAVRGNEPATGRSLFISMHGGGETTAGANDSQWNNQIALVDGYMPQDALWVAPRAPSNTWNMWFTPEVDPLLQRLITNLIVFENVDPNRVYLTGYSAGGDGVYQLGPRMADCWAGAAMSAGHPNDASPLNLRNVAFAIHVGGADSAYERNEVARSWGEQLDELANEDATGGYPHEWQVHPGLPHWMNLADAVAIPFLQMHSRNPVPNKIVWQQSAVTHGRSYWLAVDADQEQPDTAVTAAYSDRTVELSDVVGLQRLKVRFSDAMFDLDQPVAIEYEGRTLFSGHVERTIAVLHTTLAEREDPALMYTAEVIVDLPEP